MNSGYWLLYSMLFAPELGSRGMGLGHRYEKNAALLRIRSIEKHGSVNHLTVKEEGNRAEDKEKNSET